MHGNVNGTKTQRSNFSINDKAKTKEDWRQLRSLGHKTSSAAEALALPRSTVLDLVRPVESEFDAATHSFLESSSGAAFITAMLNSILYSFVVKSRTGVAALCEIITRSGLQSFVPSSDSYWQLKKQEMESVVVIEGDIIEHELITAEAELVITQQNGDEKEISVRVDESWPGGNQTLTAQEVVSRYVFFATRSDKRAGRDWARVWFPVMKLFRFRLFSLVADGGSGIASFASEYLGVPVFRDLFHLTNDVNKSIGGKLATKQRQLEKSVEDLRAQIATCKLENKNVLGKDKTTIEEAERLLANRERQLLDHRALREKKTALVKRISEAYFPVCFITGGFREIEEMSSEMDSLFTSLEQIAEQIGITIRQQELLKKARRTGDAMIANVREFFKSIDSDLSSITVQEEENAVRNQLVPAILVERFAETCGNSSTVCYLQKMAERLRSAVASTIQDCDDVMDRVSLIAEKIANR
jgi:hypothetical protein